VNSAIDIHDSRLTSITLRGDVLELCLRAYIHKSDGTPSVYARTSGLPASAGSHCTSWNTARKACSHSIQAAVIPPSAGCFTAIVRVMSMTSLRSVEQEEIDTAREWAAYEGRIEGS
jgi:hypothetical protein